MALTLRSKHIHWILSTHFISTYLDLFGQTMSLRYCSSDLVTFKISNHTLWWTLSWKISRQSYRSFQLWRRSMGIEHCPQNPGGQGWCFYDLISIGSWSFPRRTFCSSSAVETMKVTVDMSTMEREKSARNWASLLKLDHLLILKKWPYTAHRAVVRSVSSY